MSDRSPRWQELDSVLDRVLDDLYGDEDLRRLNEILRADAQACRRYMHYVELHGRLAWGDAVAAAATGAVTDGATVQLPQQHGAASVGTAVGLPYRDGEGEGRAGGSLASSDALPLMLQASPDLPAPYSPLGGFLFSYAVAAAIVAVGLLVGWMYQISVSRQPIAQQVSRTAPPPLARIPDTRRVGRVTGTFECQWAEGSTAAAQRDDVRLGHRYALASGAIELSYYSGATVILQGPCTYQVESAAGGYLELGKLTARVEKRAEGGGRRAEDGEWRGAGGLTAAQTRMQGGQLPSALRPPPSTFSVRTPTAVVTDLGTEFGVEVDRSGASRAEVFRGKVEVRAADRPSAAPLRLGANQSVRVALGNDRALRVAREAGPPHAFLREMPKSLPIVLFNTGVGLKEGGPDPHWQIVARSDQPNFQPRPAIVVQAGTPADLQNQPARSQWLSPLGDVVLPEEVVYVFRTSFELKTPFSRAALHGRFIADDRVVAIRLNGHSLSVPLQHDGEPFCYWTKFRAAAGFVKGKNVLEIDVLNANPLTPPSKRRTAQSRVGCRVEIEGEVFCEPSSNGGGDASGTSLARPEMVNGHPPSPPAPLPQAGEGRDIGTTARAAASEIDGATRTTTGS